MAKRRERILVIQMKRIGDLILTIPAIQVLRRLKPDAHITVATLGAAGQIVPAIPGIDEHFDYQYRRANLAIWNELALGHWDTVLDFNGSDRTAFMTLLSGAENRATYTKRAMPLLSKSKQKPSLAKRVKARFREIIYPHRSDASLLELHTVDHMVALGEAVGLPQVLGEPLRLNLPAAVIASAVTHLPDEPFAVVHPGTARAEKYWPADRWAAVIDHLWKAKQLPVVITGGRDSKELRHLAKIEAALAPETPRPLLLAGKLTLLETAAVIERCELALGVDTAAMHLAAAFEKPQIVLFGPTNPYHWGPRHKNATVVYPGGNDWEQKMPQFPMTEISSEAVIDRIP